MWQEHFRVRLLALLFCAMHKNAVEDCSCEDNTSTYTDLHRELELSVHSFRFQSVLWIWCYFLLICTCLLYSDATVFQHMQHKHSLQ